MATTIRQTAFARRRETGIMRLVGASDVTIQLPFVMETVVAALLGAGLAMGMLWATVRFGVTGYLSTALLDTAFIRLLLTFWSSPRGLWWVVCCWRC